MYISRKGGGHFRHLSAKLLKKQNVHCNINYLAYISGMEHVVRAGIPNVGFPLNEEKAIFFRGLIEPKNVMLISE